MAVDQRFLKLCDWSIVFGLRLKVLFYRDAVKVDALYIPLSLQIGSKVLLVAVVLDGERPRIHFVVFPLEEFPLLVQGVVGAGVVVRPFVQVAVNFFLEIH